MSVDPVPLATASIAQASRCCLVIDHACSQPPRLRQQLVAPALLAAASLVHAERRLGLNATQRQLETIAPLHLRADVTASCTLLCPPCPLVCRCTRRCCGAATRRW